MGSVDVDPENGRCNLSTTFNEPVAIVGIGCRFPGGVSGPSSLWDLLADPQDIGKPVPGSRFSEEGFTHPQASHHGTTNNQKAYWLEQDHKAFDAAFFNVSPREAESMDPQHRFLLETTYEALEDAGISLQQTRGTDTAVFVGQMTADFHDVQLRSIDTLAIYAATGGTRSITSNRLSYFFDWHGPSVTLDTACSSSLLAVHYAVQTLKLGDARVAIAAGCTLNLGPEMFVMESNLSMLSPGGKSRMFDASADGFGRGEGFSVVVLKTLREALQDGDHIYSLIRATGANQDGRTPGIAMPSVEAQAALIRSTYTRSGLDPTAPSGRCHFFEAHGTGTPTGDPLEAEAICKAFFPSQPQGNHSDGPPLYCGSIKTVIGHTEGAAGLAGLLKASLSVQRAQIPANLHFQEPNPRVKPFMGHLAVPTSRISWPSNTACRRASVNSFGLGGTNVHAIVENFQEPVSDGNMKAGFDEDVLTPIVFSAATTQSLAGLVQQYIDHVTATPEIPLKHLAWTLQQRRTWFEHRIAFTGRSRQSLVAQMGTALKNGIGNVSSIPIGIERPRILGVFTGQGAQWAQMGRKLLSTSACFAATIRKLQKTLDSVPETAGRPDWTIEEELQLGPDDSRINDAEISQPLLTAIQIALVDLMEAAGIEFDVVVGHSSGETAAAYAAGFIDAAAAIKVAYYRGKACKVGATRQPGQAKGGMMAVALSWDEAQELCSDPNFAGHVTVAASNSPKSVTLSGNMEKVREIQNMLKEKNIPATLLRVDQAYHSKFMKPCAAPFLQGMLASGYITLDKSDSKRRPLWISSVTRNLITADNLPESIVDGSYWVDNLLNPVRFCEAIEAISDITELPIHLGVEIGPHPALRRQATQTYQTVGMKQNGKSLQQLPYSGSLSRGVDDEDAFSTLLGFLWQAGVPVSFQRYREACNGAGSKNQVPRRAPLISLPNYSWDHSRQYWRESTHSLALNNRPAAQSELLGRSVEKGGPGTGTEWRWSNILRLSELPWLNGHQIEHQTVFPAAAYCIMAADAAVHMAEYDLEWCELHDVIIHRAMQISTDRDIETLVRLREVDMDPGDGRVSYEFSISARPAVNGNGGYWHACSGRITVPSSASAPDRAVKSRIEEPVHLRPLDIETFYAGFAEVGLQYADAFRLDSIQRTLGRARASITGPSMDSTKNHQGKFLTFPTATLDACLQTTAAALAFPGDGQMQSAYLPTSVNRLHFNLAACRTAITQPTPRFVIDAVLNDPQPDANSPSQSRGLLSSVEGIDEASKDILFRVDGLGVVPLTTDHDPYGEGIFFEELWALDVPDALKDFQCEEDASLDSVEYVVAERLALYYMRRVFDEFHQEEAESPNTPWFIKRFYEWLEYRLIHVPLERMHHATSPSSPEEILADVPHLVRQSVQNSVLVKLLAAVGENTARVMRQEEGPTMLEVLFKDDMLSRMYVEPNTIARANRYLGRVAGIISHRFPRCDIIEIGAGTGGATGSMLSALQGAFKSYTFTDVSAAFFSAAKTKFQHQPGADRMKFKSLDVEKDITEQGFQMSSYDVVVASNVIHATEDVGLALSNARRLLKPGGYLLLLEVTSSPLIVPFLMGVIPGWWLHDDEYRHGTHSPLMDAKTWDTVLKKYGFTGADFVFHDMQDEAKHISSVMIAQASTPSWDWFRSGALFETAQLQQHPSPEKKPEPQNLFVVRSAPAMISQGVSHFLEYTLLHIEGSSRTIQFSVNVSTCSSLEAIIEPSLCELLEEPTTTVLVLSDLDSKPVLQEPVQEKEFVALKHLFDKAKNVFWVTQRRHSEQPEHNTIVGLGRCITREALELKLRFVDIEDINDMDSIQVFSRILKQAMAESNRKIDAGPDTEEWLWSEESEFVIKKGGKLFLPRLKPIKDSNNRYLAERRRVLQGQRKDEEAAGAHMHKNPVKVCGPFPPPNTLFRAERTYLFAGLTGDLALSIAKWMIVNGASHIVMASRRPQIPSTWLEEMHRLQPRLNIKILQMDVTSKESVKTCCDRISQAMPPIAGILFGAMVLNDTMFSNMSLQALTTTLAPKVEGAKNLDEYFYRTELDFFIFTSSFSCIVGTRGQSNYSAANMFGRALMAQRRNVRGLAASTIDLSTVFGVGYFAGADTEKRKNVLINLRGLNAMAVSERDLHAAVHEAIVRGKPGSGTQMDLLVGLGTETAFPHLGLPVWHTDARFSHVTGFGDEGTMTHKNNGSSAGCDALSVGVGRRLSQVESPDDKTEVLSSCLGDAIASTMLLDKERVRADVPLTDLGVDSLVAVDLRAWFFKELGINVPVLRILNGESIRAICKAALLEIAALA